MIIAIIRFDKTVIFFVDFDKGANLQKVFNRIGRIDLSLPDRFGGGSEPYATGSIWRTVRKGALAEALSEAELPRVE